MWRIGEWVRSRTGWCGRAALLWVGSAVAADGTVPSRFDWQDGELLGVFEKHHVTTVDALGEAFDPSVHEAIAQAPDGNVVPNTVIDVLQKGYQLRDRLVRPARVVVARAPDEADEAKESSESGSGESTG